MGGDLFYGGLPETFQSALSFFDGSFLSLRFWWFGYVHLFPLKEYVPKQGPSSFPSLKKGSNCDLDKEQNLSYLIKKTFRVLEATISTICCSKQDCIQVVRFPA